MLTFPYVRGSASKDGDIHGLGACAIIISYLACRAQSYPSLCRVSNFEGPELKNTFFHLFTDMQLVMDYAVGWGQLAHTQPCTSCRVWSTCMQVFAALLYKAKGSSSNVDRSDPDVAFCDDMLCKVRARGHSYLTSVRLVLQYTTLRTAR